MHRHKHIFSLSIPHLENAIMLKKKMPLFVFSLRFHELYCLVDGNDPEKVIDGNDSQKTLVEMLIYVIPHPEPDVEKSGHKWAIINII